MTEKMLDTKLTLPEALMAFLHNKDGQVYHSARPKQLTAAAELGELALAGHVTLEDEKLVTGTPVDAGERPWMTEVVEGLPDKPVTIDSWIRKRPGAVKVQQTAAVEQGVLTKDRAKLGGLVGYDRHMVDEATRDALLAELDAPDATASVRAKALAKLISTPGLVRIAGFEDSQVERWKALAESDEGTPLPGPLFTAMEYGIATAVAVTVLGD